MKKQTVLSWVLLIVSVVLGIVSYCVLPDTVVTQFSFHSSHVTVAPKPLAVLLPLVLGAGGAASCLIVKNDIKICGKGLIVSVVGIAVFVLMLIVNL